jgi:acyl-CoA synthetase (NDP forming)
MDITKETYRRLFHPESIAVVGASNDELKPGGRVTKNIKDNNFTGQLWAVNPKTPNILGLPTYQTISDLPDIPDLAIVAIPARFVLPTLHDLADKGAKAVIVLTAGFGEKDDAGKVIEQEMLALAEKAGMALVGPNCSGFLTPTYKGKFAGIIPTIPGNKIDFISGSGATVDYVMEHASTRGLSFGTVINLGNSIQLGVEDLLEMYDQNYGETSARFLMLYIESVKKPRKLLIHAQNLAAKGCTLVGIKSGATSAGARAAASHTGAMASSDTAVEALFKKAGIIRVKSRMELIDVACVLTAANGRMKGNRVCIITDAGGPGVMLSDELNRQGMELPELTQPTLDQLAKILPPESSIVNPIDALPSRTAEQIRDIIAVLNTYEADRLDAITVLTGDSGMSDNAPIYDEIAKAMKESPIPVLPMLSSVTSSKEKLDAFISSSNIFFPDEVAMGAAMGKIAAPQAVATDTGTSTGYNKSAIAGIIGKKAGALPPQTVTAVLEAAGFKLPAQIEVFKEEDLAAACKKAIFPLVMKVIGPLHKTDVGGVILGINDLEEASEAWKTLLNIPDAEGALVQPMIKGTEVILGASREGDFGHLVMFGLGGIHAEIFKDVSFSLAPVTANESHVMIRGIKSFKVLEGFRGEPGMNLDMLAGNIQRLGQLVSDFPQIEEMDLNPIKGFGTALYAVDARIIVSKET